MEVEQEVSFVTICPDCGHKHIVTHMVYVEVEPSELAQDTYGD